MPPPPGCVMSAGADGGGSRGAGGARLPAVPPHPDPGLVPLPLRGAHLPGGGRGTRRRPRPHRLR